MKSAAKRICGILLSLALLFGGQTSAMAQRWDSSQSPALRTVRVQTYQDSLASSRIQKSRYAASSLSLSQNAVQARDTMAKALLGGDSEVDLTSYRISADDFLNIVNFVIFTDYPEISDIRSYEYQVDLSGLVHGVQFQYNYSREQILARSAQLSKAADAVLKATVSDGMSTLQKILAVHNYLVLHCAYDQRVQTNNVPEDSFTAYGVLVNRVAVCQGYAAAFQLLMNKLNIRSIVVQSTAMNHAWNMVQYNGEWYHVDATWDDPVPDQPGVVYTYAFMKSDGGISDSINRHYSWDSAGYRAENTQFDKNFNWKPYVVSESAAAGMTLDTKSYAGGAGAVYQFLAKPAAAGDTMTALSSDPSVATVELTNAKDSRGALFTVRMRSAGTAKILVTSAGGGIQTMTVTVNEASKAA